MAQKKTTKTTKTAPKPANKFCASCVYFFGGGHCAQTNKPVSPADAACVKHEARVPLNG